MRRVHGGEAVGRGRVWRAASATIASAVLLVGVGGSVANAEEPVEVAVGLPPVPPTQPVVEVGLPPVPPTQPVVEVGLPPVPPLPDTWGDDSADVLVDAAVGLPPLPDTWGDDGDSAAADVSGAIAGAIAATATAAWRTA